MSWWNPFEWITALRFLKEGRLQTIFILVAVAIGVAVIVFMSALLSSLQANFIKRVLTSQPHIQPVRADETARPLRSNGNGQIVVPIVQRPAQRIRSTACNTSSKFSPSFNSAITSSGGAPSRNATTSAPTISPFTVKPSPSRNRLTGA